MERLSILRKRVDRGLASYRLAKRALAEEEAALEDAEQRRASLETAQALAQEVAAQIQSRAHARIAETVSHCLQVIFPEDPYAFRIEFERKRGRTEASLKFERNGEEYDPLTEAGGGVVDVAAFALRLSAVLLSLPPGRRLLVMDEPFRFLRKALHPRVRVLLESLATEMGVQMVMVTHEEGLRAGRIIEVGA